jgi:hypothetical protein
MSRQVRMVGLDAETHRLLSQIAGDRPLGQVVKEMTRRRLKLDPPPRRLKLNLSLDAETHRLLCAFAGYHHREISAVVADAVLAHMAGFRVDIRPGVGATQTVTSPAPPSASPGRPQGEPERPVVGRVG